MARFCARSGRNITGSLQVDELRREVEILSQSHERDVDRKDALLLVRATQQQLVWPCCDVWSVLLP